MSKSPFGNSRVGGQTRKYVKLKDGTQMFRILPAMGDLAEDGRWSYYHAVHYGYKNSKGKMRTFVSPLVKGKNGMIEVPDAALERINNLTAQMEKAKAEKNEELYQRLNKLVGRGPNSKAQFNLDKNHFINALDKDGNVVILQLRHKAKLALDEEIKKLRAKGIDPLSPEQGRYFNFTRTGKDRDTLVQVTPAMKDVDLGGGRIVQEQIVHVIDDALIKRLLKEKDGKWVYNEAANLETLFPKPTADEVLRIVKEGAKAVDEILDKGKASDAEAESEPSEYEDEKPSAVAGTRVDSTPAQQAAAAASPAAAVQTQPAAEPVQAPPAQPAQQAPAAAAPATSAPPPFAKSTTAPPKSSAQNLADMSDEDFLNSLE